MPRRVVIIGYPDRLVDDHAVLVRAAADAGFDAQLVAPSRLALVTGGETGETVLLDGEPCRADAVMPRGVNRAWPMLRQICEVFVRGGARIVPDPAAIDVCADKVLTTRVLAAAGVATLTTVAVVAGDGVTADSLGRALAQSEVVIKPARGSKARGVERYPSVADAAASLHGGRDLIDKMVDHQLVQPLATGAGTDYRVVVAGGDVVSITRRRALHRGFLTNRGDVEFSDLDPTGNDPRTVAIAAVAQRAAVALDLDFGGIDVIEHRGAAVVLEANAWPGLAPEVLGTRLASALVATMARHLGPEGD